VPLELQVLERVILGARDRQIVARVIREPARECPRDQHAVALEPQVPVQPAGVMLLDHEAA
jgi:hypothetical protein